MDIALERLGRKPPKYHCINYSSTIDEIRGSPLFALLVNITVGTVISSNFCSLQALLVNKTKKNRIKKQVYLSKQIFTTMASSWRLY